MKRPPLPVFETVVMAALTAVLLLQKQLLTFLPNVTLNFFLILLYSKVLGLGRTAAIVTVYLLLDSILWGSINPIFTTAQWIGWMWGPLITCTLFSNDAFIGINALIDIGALCLDIDEHTACLIVEAFERTIVTNFLNGIAGNALNIDIGRSCYLTCDDDNAGF